MKLFMVTDGSYSDYHVCGIYSTQEAAERAKQVFNAHNSIEEIELDAVPASPPGLWRWGLRMEDDGSVPDAPYRESCEGVTESIKWFPMLVWAGQRPSVYFSVWAEDRKHAIKVANEARIGLKASGQWTTDRDEYNRRRTQR
jgi:hypothetical protein